MKSRKQYALLVLACLAAALTFSLAGFAHEPESSTAPKGMAGHSAGSMELHRIMSKGHSMQMPMSGDVDRDFAAMMQLHHQQAVEMADVMIQQGRNAELKAMARKMKAAQQEEIKQLARFAGPMGKAMPMDHGKMASAEFARLDQNKDGKLTKAEIKSADPLSAHFDMLDADKDGSLSAAEFAKHHGM